MAGIQSTNRVLIRVDSSTRIGTGHMMRCLTLAEQLRAKNCDVTFVARAHPGNINSAVAEKGFSLTELPAPPPADAPIKDADYPAWLGVTQDQDAQETLAATGGNHFDWLVVDHYSLDAQWEAQMRAKARKIMAIDDLANRPHDCDALLDSNFYRNPNSRYNSLVPPTATLLLGPQYALLRPEFHALQNRRKGVRGEVSRIFICLGGVDRDNVTLRLANLILPSLNPSESVFIAVGNGYKHGATLSELANHHDRFRWQITPPNLATLMNEADCLFVGGGSLALEALSVNLNTNAVVLAENQLDPIMELYQGGFLQGYLDARRNIGPADSDVLDFLMRKTNEPRGYLRSQCGLSIGVNSPVSVLT